MHPVEIVRRPTPAVVLRMSPLGMNLNLSSLVMKILRTVHSPTVLVILVMKTKDQEKELIPRSILFALITCALMVVQQAKIEMFTLHMINLTPRTSWLQIIMMDHQSGLNILVQWESNKKRET
jgi:hypothetical protein